MPDVVFVDAGETVTINAKLSSDGRPSVFYRYHENGLLQYSKSTGQTETIVVREGGELEVAALKIRPNRGGQIWRIGP